MTYKDFLVRALHGIHVKVVGIDPGETTGICTFKGADLLNADQVPSGNVVEGAKRIGEYIDSWQPDVVVIEDYRVYSWKADEHSWAALHTPRLIGALELSCHVLGKPLIKQTAQQAKGFCDDQKLKAWDLWIPGKKHSRDAIRHALYHLLFTCAKVQERKPNAPQVQT